MRINSRGQVTIPKRVREQAGLLPHDQVEFFCEWQAVRIVRADDKDRSRGARLIAHMRGRGSGTLTTKKIMAMTRRR